ncbi:Guanylate-binding family protein isoform 1 [Hibiscus syriacus]|uniref:Guanylate-binding family protein isoform 1 n=1 Tax=Hibiscus syriacus TaxID=106335 RepID=A0A6A2Y394_HIBSY|nr:Guanylate-binding family protein isoform 1 [Hibiscus syriacus]
MGSIVEKYALIIYGDYMENYEVMVPFWVPQAFGVRLYSKLPGYLFTLISNFDEVKAKYYDALTIPRGRFTELLSVDDKVLGIVKGFANSPIATSCHSQLLLAAAGLLKGKKCTAFASMKPVIELAGSIWWEQRNTTSGFDITACLKDGNILSSIGWPAYAEYLKTLFESMGARVHATKTNSVLSYVGLRIQCPIPCAQALGCKVDTATPRRKKGETCVTATTTTKEPKFSARNVVITCLSQPIGMISVFMTMIALSCRGRSPKLLVMNDNAVNLVKEFAEKNGALAGIGQGQWLLAVAGWKRCACGHGMKVMVKMGGGDVEESKGCVSDGKPVTAIGWSALPSFISQLSRLLGLSFEF